MNCVSVFGHQIEAALKLLDSLGLTTEGDTYVKNEDLRRAVNEYDGVLGGLEADNEMLRDGLVIDLNRYEEETEKKWILEKYIRARMAE